jgi:hypothetical protein
MAGASINGDLVETDLQTVLAARRGENRRRAS